MKKASITRNNRERVEAVINDLGELETAAQAIVDDLNTSLEDVWQTKDWLDNGDISDVDKWVSKMPDRWSRDVIMRLQQVIYETVNDELDNTDEIIYSDLVVLKDQLYDIEKALDNTRFSVTSLIKDIDSLI